jgi:nicotinamidase-related amidase
MVTELAPEQSIVLVIDIQQALASSIVGMDRVVDRVVFLLKVANLLGVPVMATEQNPQKMGPTVEELAPWLGQSRPKMDFSAMRSSPDLARRQAVVVGIETHICVSQTVRDLIGHGAEVLVCGDAVSARSIDRHELGLERIRHYGAAIGHSEAVAYEWMGTADHPKFREVLKAVKEHPPSIR